MAEHFKPQRQLPPHLGQPIAPNRNLVPFDLPPSPAGPSALPEDEEGDEENIFRDATFDEVLEDLNARFLVNLPEEEMSLVRLYWQAEQAHWFYEDYIRPLNPLLPSLSQRQFTHLVIASSPFYANTLGADIDYDAVWAEYCAYKKMVPCCGGILINSSGDKVLMVRGWKSNAGWCFPRGKINFEESEVACAIREVEEETGFDMSKQVRAEDFIKSQVNTQEITMFMVKDIDESTVFETQTRNEIGAIEWVPLADLPTWTNKKGPKRTGGKGQKRFYNVTPFVGPLKKWMVKNGINPNPQRRKERGTKSQGRDLQPFAFGQGDHSRSETPTERDLKPFSFDDGPQADAATPTTAIDQLFSKFVQQDDKAVAMQSDNARTLDRLFGDLEVAPAKSKEQEEMDRQDDMLAKLLGNVGTTDPVDDPATPSLPAPANTKQSQLLAMLNPSHPTQSNPPQSGPAQVNRFQQTATMHTPQRSTHQTNLLSLLSPPKPAAQPLSPPRSMGTMSQPPGGEDERASRQRALLESLGPTTPMKPNGPYAGHVHPQPMHGSNVSPMPLLPPQVRGGQYGASYPSGPPQPHVVPYPQPSQHAPPGSLGSQQHSYNSASFEQSPLPPRTAPPPSQPSQHPQPTTDHQRALLGTLFSAPRSQQPQVAQHPTSYPVPSTLQQWGGPNPRGPPQVHAPLQYSVPNPSQVPYQRHGGLPAQPGPGMAFGQGLPGQPGAMHQHAGPPGSRNVSGLPGAPPIPQGHPVGPLQHFQGFPPPAQMHAQQPPHQHHQQYQQQPPQLHQPEQQQQAATYGVQREQTPPTMHQPVARPPVGGSLLGLAAGR